MANLKFANTHNMVPFLSKPTKSKGFKQIVDFLNAHPIKYALTVNPTIYTSCIEQFWATIKAKTVNREVQLQALVDGKKIIITKSTMRGDLQLEDVEGVDCLPNATIFEQLALKQKPRKPKRKDTQIPQSSGPTKHVANEAVYKELDDSLVRAATIASSLEAEQDSGNILKTRSKATPNEAGSKGTTSGGGPKRQETMGDTITQTWFENVSKLSNDPLLTRGNTLRSGKDSLKFKELMELCTNLQTRVLDLEKTKTTQAEEIINLKRRVKKLEQKKRSRTHGLKRLYKVGLKARVESFRDEESLGDDASKQERINAIDANEDITLVNDQDDADMFDVNTLTSDEVLAEQEVAAKDVNLTVDEVTLAQLLATLKSVKPKVKANVVEKPSIPVSVASTKISATTTTTTPTIIISVPKPPQDKGKGINIEEPFEEQCLNHSLKRSSLEQNQDDYNVDLKLYDSSFTERNLKILRRIQLCREIIGIKRLLVDLRVTAAQVTDISKMDKNEQKWTNPSTGLEEYEKSKPKAYTSLNGPTRSNLLFTFPPKIYTEQRRTGLNPFTHTLPLLLEGLPNTFDIIPIHIGNPKLSYWWI
ncbi:hypothetical protein Tco_0347266 [Tanacetum coccineum]